MSPAPFEFRSRGIGQDTNNPPGCFVCGGDSEPRIAAYVASRSDGEAIVALFGRGARLEYRASNLDDLRVKVWSCRDHGPALVRLHVATSVNNTINAGMIASAKRTVVPGGKPKVPRL
jgi:hypothetical protein